MSVAHEIFVWFGSVLPTQDFFFQPDNLILIKWVDNVNWPPQIVYKDDVLSVSLSSEQKCFQLMLTTLDQVWFPSADIDTDWNEHIPRKQRLKTQFLSAMLIQ